MAKEYIEAEQTLKAFAKRLNNSIFDNLMDSFFDEPVLLHEDDGSIDTVTAITSDYFQRLTQGEFVEVEQYLSELCIHIEDQDLRDELITEFDLDREYIESEL